MDAGESDLSIGAKIVSLHRELMAIWPELSRMAVAIYDRESDDLKTFIHSDGTEEILTAYSAKLSTVESLKELADQRKDRIIEDLNVFDGSESAHCQWLLRAGFKSSYTLPLYGHDYLLGFLFFDAIKPNYFDDLIVKSLNVYAELIEALLINELAPVYTLRGAINTATYLTHQRDTETASHIKRMSHYAHLLARKLADLFDLDDEYIEFILQYSPLHDIGKIGIEDDLLLKPGKLTTEEYKQVKLHVEKGMQIIDAIIEEFDLGQLKHLQILYNIIGSHHEKMDGSGYPKGLKGQGIPLEGRIVAVADVLDALSHPRPYKPAWSFDDSVKYIEDHSGSHFDPDCVNVLLSNIDEFRQIFDYFRED